MRIVTNSMRPREHTHIMNCDQDRAHDGTMPPIIIKSIMVTIAIMNNSDSKNRQCDNHIIKE